MSKIAAAIALLLLPQIAQAQSMSVHSTRVVTVQHRQTILDVPIGAIANGPASATVINNDIPGLLSDSHYAEIRGMSLRTVAALSGGDLTHAMLLQTEADLNALPSSRNLAQAERKPAPNPWDQ